MRRADHSTRGVLLSLVCLIVIDEPHTGGPGLLTLSSQNKKQVAPISQVRVSATLLSLTVLMRKVLCFGGIST